MSEELAAYEWEARFRTARDLYEATDVASLRQPPVFSPAGVYVLWRDEEIVYVGQSKAVWIRVTQHCFEFDEVSIIEVGDEPTRRLLEFLLIERHDPPENNRCDLPAGLMMARAYTWRMEKGGAR